MKLEIFNESGKRVFITCEKSCFPKKSEINTMSKVGWKFKLDDKRISKKNLEEIIVNKKG